MKQAECLECQAPIKGELETLVCSKCQEYLDGAF